MLINTKVLNYNWKITIQGMRLANGQLLISVLLVLYSIFFLHYLNPH